MNNKGKEKAGSLEHPYRKPNNCWAIKLVVRFFFLAFSILVDWFHSKRILCGCSFGRAIDQMRVERFDCSEEKIKKLFHFSLSILTLLVNTLFDMILPWKMDICVLQIHNKTKMFVFKILSLFSVRMFQWPQNAKKARRTKTKANKSLVDKILYYLNLKFSLE